jgi:hypothetical protein
MTEKHSALEDERQIQKLVLNYARGADKRDGALFASVFTEDGVLDYNGRQSTGPNQLSKIPGALEIYEKTYHTVLNTFIEVEGDTAAGEIYSASHHLRPIENGEFSDRVMYITYRDEYQRTADGWRIAKRKVDVEFIEYTTVNMRG